MAGKNEAKIRFSADTREFTEDINRANSTLAALRAGLKLNEAEFKNTGDKAEYLKKKHKLLQLELDANKQKQEALNQKLQTAKRVYGDNSEEAKKYTIQLTRAKIEEQNLTSSINGCEEELEELHHELLQGEDALNGMEQATKDAGDAAESASNGGWTMAKHILANLASEVLSELIQKLKEAAVYMVQTGMEFEASLSNVEALSGASAEEMERLTERAKELGRSTVFSASQVSDAFSYMALAGWDTSSMLEGVDGVLNLAASAQMDLADASDIVTDNLTAFGLSASDSGRLVDQMAYAMSHSNTNVEQLGEAYKNCAATATSMGYSVEDTTAALMIMANAGIKGGEAGTGLSAIMTRLATNTQGCADKLGEYGIQVFDAKGNMKSFASILTGCSEVWSGLSMQEQSALAKSIAGTEHFAKLQTIMSGLSDTAKENGQSFTDYANALEHCEGAAQNMADTMTDNLKGAVTELGSATEGLGIALYDKIKGPLTGAAKIATNVINGITDAIAPQKTELEQFIDDIEASNKAVKESVENSKSVMDSATGDVAKIEAYKRILLELNSTEQKSEFQKYQLKSIVEELSGSIPELAEAFDEETSSIKLTNEEIVDLMQNQKDLVMQKALLEAQEEAYKAQAEAMLNVAKAQSALEEATNELNQTEEENRKTTSFMEGGYGDLYGKVVDLQEAQHNAANELEQATKLQEEATKQADITEAAMDKLKGTFDSTADSTEELGNKQQETGRILDEFGNDITNMSEEEAAAVTESSRQIQEAYEEMVDSISNSISQSINMFEEFSGGAKISAEEVVHNLDSQIDGISNWSSNLQRLAGEAGNGMTQEFYQYLADLGPESANLVQMLVDTLDGNTEEFREICAKWGQAMSLTDNADVIASGVEAGKQAAKGVEDGLKDGQSGVSGAVNDLSKATSTAMSSCARNMQQSSSSMQKTFSNLRSNAQTSMNGLKSDMLSSSATMKVASSSMKGSFSAMNSDFTIAAQNIKSSVGQIKSSVDDMRSALSVTLRGPNIQVPHFKMTGKFDMEKSTVPNISVEWYAKGAVFSNPTIFATPYGYKGVGEAGPEFVSPVNVLQGYVMDAVEKATATNRIDEDSLARKIAIASSKLNISVGLDKRELGRVVREVM